MSFKKDGEIKIFLPKSSDGNKNASSDKPVRYTIDDLVKDLGVDAAEDESEEGEEDVFNQAAL